MGKQLKGEVDAINASLSNTDVAFTINESVVNVYDNLVIRKSGNVVTLNGRAFLNNLTDQFQTMLQITDYKCRPSDNLYGLWSSSDLALKGDLIVRKDGHVTLRLSGISSTSNAVWCYFNVSFVTLVS